MKPKTTRFPQTIPVTPALVALLAVSLPLIALLPGCGGSKSSTDSVGVMPTSGTTVAQDGAMSISVPGLSSDSRVLPDKGRYLKVEIFDIQEGTGTTIPPRIAIPLTLNDTANGVQLSDDKTFVRIDRGESSVSPMNVSFIRLPVKNLILRVSAYKDDPIPVKKETITPLPTPSPTFLVLAQADVPFTPQRKKPDGTGATNLSFTLDTNITALEIAGDEQITPGDGVTNKDYRLLAKVGDAISLYPATDTLSGRQVTWNYELVDGSGSAVQVSDLLKDVKTLNYRTVDPITLSAKPFLDGKDVKYGTIRITATDTESRRSAVKLVRIEPKRAPLKLDISGLPFGTRSVKVVVDPEDDTLAANTEIVRLVDAEKLNDVFSGQDFPAGTATVTIIPYSGESADGVVMGDANDESKKPVNIVPTSGAMLEAKSFIPNSTVIPNVWVIDGLEKKAVNSTDTQVISKAKKITDTILGSTQTPDPRLIAGQSYKVQVRAGEYRYPVTAFDLAGTSTTGTTVTHEFNPVPNISDRYQVLLPSSSINQQFKLKVQERRKGGAPRTIDIYEVVRDKGSAKVTID